MGETSDWEEGLLRNVPQESAQGQAMSKGGGSKGTLRDLKEKARAPGE